MPRREFKRRLCEEGSNICYFLKRPRLRRFSFQHGLLHLTYESPSALTPAALAAVDVYGADGWIADAAFWWLPAARAKPGGGEVGRGALAGEALQSVLTPAYQVSRLRSM